MGKILQTPSINAIAPFDPKHDKVITFEYDDNQSVKNIAIITDMETKVSVESVYIGYGNEHIILATKLEAGKQYAIKIQVFDEEGNSSLFSEEVLFYCFTAPVLSFTNVQDKGTHKNASITLDLSYVQAENEPIRSFQFMQYSSDRTLINSSEVFYSQSTTSYSFYGLENDTTYYFRAIGETKNGMILDTNYVEVYVEYKQIPLMVALDAKNDYCNGVISLTLNIKGVEYELGNDNYTLDDETLTLNDNYIKYFNFVDVDDDFSLYLDAKNVKVGKFLTTNDDIFSLSIISVCGTYYCELSVKDSNFRQYEPLPKAKLDANFQSKSSVIDVSYEDDDTVVFEVKRKNGLYGLRLYNKSEM